MTRDTDRGNVDGGGDRDEPNAGPSTGASSPIVVGWDRDTATWVSGSPIAAVLREVRNGAFLEVAGTLHGVPQIEDHVARGRRFLDRPAILEDRRLTPIDERPFVDLADAVACAEAEAELRLTEAVFRAALYDPRLALRLLERRSPEGWDPKSRPATNVQPDQQDDEFKRAMMLPQFASRFDALANEVFEYLDAEERSASANSQFE